ncbi:hypothetical protein [Amycolatopsis pigmentata]|uniref:PD-(D/E)XK nuclease superfamily protein n=1 Tax=Amycolatopsis pigmentata TaxID=450801 RepID=A0ABW5GB76_9PSEU
MSGLDSAQVRLVGDVLLAEVVAALAAERPVFHSEADFQHHLAWTVRGFDPSLRVRLEVRPVPELGLQLDLLLIQPSSGERVAVELKYATRALSVDVGGEAFYLRSHDAQDIRRHDFIKDLVRLETLVDRGVVDRGWALFLTNDHGFWQTSARVTVDAAFRLHDGQVLRSSLAWGDEAGEGTRRGRDKPLELTGAYPLRWTEFSAVAPGAAGTFRLLAVPVGGSASLAEACPTDSAQPLAEATPLPPAERVIAPRADDRDAARLQGMIDELRRLRNGCEPKDKTNPLYHRYSLAVSALKWVAANHDKN